MKGITAILILSLQLAGSSFAAPLTDYKEAEDTLQQRQRDLKDNNIPLNEEEKVLLKRLLSEKILRPNNEVSDDSNAERRNLADNDSDPLAAAMRESALGKVENNRKLQQGYNSGYNSGYNGGYNSGYNNGYNGGYNNGYNGGYNNYNGGYGDGYGGVGGAGSLVLDGNAQSQRVKVDIPEKVSMVLEAFQDSRNIEAPIRLDSQVSYLTAGTQYLYTNEPVFNVVFDIPPGGSRGAYLINQNDRVAVASGTCIRIDPKTRYVGRAYCSFEYRFLDDRGNVEASLSAEGPISKGDINTLSITGGTGIFRRTVGTVVLESGSLRSGSPPIFIPNDQRDLPSSYLIKMFVFMDSVDLELA
mmetsp:Transcript_26420/g.57895  ORF Transcript_26420/g.57895 Transcript_26420/m.57895 type:complete len:358 (+) Transcript_26420:114-1187(+)